MNSYRNILSFLIISIFLISCGNNNRTEILIEVDDQGLLAEFDIKTLRLVLVDPQADSTEITSDKTDFANEDGSSITFPTDFTATVDKGVFTQLRIGVVAIDETGRSLNAGVQNNVVVQGKDKVSVSIVLSEKNSCVAGDAADEGCCLNVLDDDENGVFDCLDTACSEVAECQGFCQDGIVQFYRGELCDDGNDIVGDGCDANCISENFEFQGTILYQQVTAGNIEVARLGSSPLFERENTVGLGLKSDSCQISSFEGEAFFGPQFNLIDLGFLQVKDSEDAVIFDLNIPKRQLNQDIGGIPIEGGENFTIEITGGNDVGPSILLSEIFPEKLTNVITPAQLIRGEDYRISWTDPGVGGKVTVSLAIPDIETSVDTIECEVDASLEELIIPGEITRVLDRGDFIANDLNSPGFGVAVGLGFNRFLSNIDGTPSKINVRVANGVLRFGDII